MSADFAWEDPPASRTERDSIESRWFPPHYRKLLDEHPDKWGRIAADAGTNIGTALRKRFPEYEFVTRYPEAPIPGKPRRVAVYARRRAS